MKLTPVSPIALKNSVPSTDTKMEGKTRQACAGFEAIILKQMLTIMRNSVPKSGLLDGGFAEDMFQSMYDDELAKQMASGRGTGLGEMLYRQIADLSGSDK